MIHPVSNPTRPASVSLTLPVVRPNIVSSSVDPELPPQAEPQIPVVNAPTPAGSPLTFRVDARSDNEAQQSASHTASRPAANQSVADSSAFIGLLNDSYAQEAITASMVNPDLNASERAESTQCMLFYQQLYFTCLLCVLNLNFYFFIQRGMPLYISLAALVLYECFTFKTVAQLLKKKHRRRKIRCMLSWEAAMFISRIAIYAGFGLYVVDKLSSPPVALVVAFIVFDALLIAQGFFNICSTSIYMQDTVAKIQFVIGITFQFGVQAVVFVCKYNAEEIDQSNNSRPFLWVLQCLYFFMGPTFLILGVVVLISICRVGESNHLRLAEEDLKKLVSSCRKSLLLQLTWYLSYFTNFIFGATLLDRYTYDEAGMTTISEGLVFITAFQLGLGVLSFYLRNQLKTFMLTKHNVLSEEDFESVVHRRAIQLAEARAGRSAGTSIQSPVRIGANAANVTNPSPVVAQPAAPKEPEVEYLEDSKISVDYFRMKGSVFFSAVAKDDVPAKTVIEKSQMMKLGNSLIPKEERVKFFAISSVNGGDDILNSVMVDNHSNSSKPNSLVSRKRKLTQQEKELLNFDKQCLICRENTVDAIYSPCFHGGVCFVCAKDNLVRKNSCYYCRENVFKVYQVKQSKANTAYYRVVKAFFVYDKREESLYDQYVQEIEEEEAEAQRALAAQPNQSDSSHLPVPAAVRINETTNTEETPVSETVNNHGLTLDIPLQRNPSKTNSMNQLSEDEHDPGRERLRSENVNPVNDHKSPLMDRRVRLESFDAMFNGTVTSNDLSPRLGPRQRSVEGPKSPFLGSAQSKSASVESLQDPADHVDEVQESEPTSPTTEESGLSKPQPQKLTVGRTSGPNRPGLPAAAIGSRVTLNQIEEVEEHLA